MAATTDTSPWAGKGPVNNGPDAWGSLIRSFSLSQPSGVKAGAANIAPHSNGIKAFVTGAWTSFTGFGVYNADTGALLGTVSASTTGFRDGTGKCHLGNGYFVMNTGGPGPARSVALTETGSAPYFNMVINASTPVIASCGRGISWGGTYYYATTGSWSTPVGIYTSAGSQVGTWVLSSTILSGLYGIASTVSNNGYLYTYDQASGSPIRQSNSSGSIVRSFNTPSSSAGGLDGGWSDGYLYACSQTPNTTYVYDGELAASGIAPESLGKIKSLYR
jgi:hypothetical protein